MSESTSWFLNFGVLRMKICDQAYFILAHYVVNNREQRSATIDPCLLSDLLALKMKLAGHERIITERHVLF